jgi:glucosamine kinase
MPYYLAIDNGGTKTDYALADETRVLARVRSGTIKRMRTDADSAQTNLDGALEQLASISGVALKAVSRTCVGTAGNTVPLVTDWLRAAIPTRVGGELTIVGDVEIALDAAFQGGAGVLVLAGTGSNVAARAADGELTTAGGWGPALSDQGSGHRIGLEALRACFLSLDEGQRPATLDAVLNFWNLRNIDDLVAYANRLPAPDFSRLTEVVLGCAHRADAVAMRVLRREGEELAYLVRLVVRRLHPAGTVPAIAFAGSIMEKVLPVREALIDAVRQEFPLITALDGVVDPLEGALWRARLRKEA